MRKIGSHGSAKLTTINAAAAAIDIGSKMHMAAVDPACSDNPVRSFGTFTRTASARGLVSILRSDDYRDGVDGRLLDPRLRDP